MLFECGTDVFESEKERNLYYKFFAGYLFNEFIDGIEERVQQFCEVLNQSDIHGKTSQRTKLVLDAKNAHVSFDNHAYLFSSLEKIDRGEFADIFIHDSTNNILVTIEAKVHEDWDHGKDIVSNFSRIKRIQANLKGKTLVPVLLIKQEKWLNAKKHANQTGSNVYNFFDEEDNEFRVVFWEALISHLPSDDRVKQFVESYLNHPPGRASYAFSSSWFERS